MDYREVSNTVLSEKRLQKYGSLNPSSLLDTYARYLWNIRLCEALYPALNGLEVALRNRIHHELVAKTNNARWMDARHKLLKSNESRLVSKAEGDLRRARKSTGVDQLISALSLGFWVNLFAYRYESTLWRGHSLRGVFPFAPKAELGCHSIRFKLNRIKYLRNRVFHHESIWDWKDLDSTYADVVKLTSWLSRDWSSLAARLDRFPTVLIEGYQPILAQL